MSDFSPSEIEMAKKRVQEMKNRARQYIDSPDIQDNSIHFSNNVNNQNNKDNNHSNAKKTPFEKENAFNSNLFDKGFLHDLLGSQDSSLILALVLILSREGADNMLILALLYILL